MTKHFAILSLAAAMALTFASARDAQAWFGRNGGGSSGSYGSHGGSSFGGSHGSNGSFGGLFSRRSHGSSGGSQCDNCCGGEGEVRYGGDSNATTPPPAPADPGAAPEKRGGATSASTSVPPTAIAVNTAWTSDASNAAMINRRVGRNFW